MRVFISWSGEQAKCVARALRNWIPNVLQSTRTWMSEEDIRAGSHWLIELSETLNSTDFAIICLTREAKHKPWLLFEAGAISKSLSEAVVIPYLVKGMSVADLPDPLRQFNAVNSDKDGTRKLVEAINEAKNKRRLDWERLNAAFERWWPMLEKEFEKVPPMQRLSESSAELGLLALRETRSAALQEFEPFLKSEGEREQAEIWIVGTSFRETHEAHGTEFWKKQLIRLAAGSIRIMLIDPEVVGYRERLPERTREDIEIDIGRTLIKLESYGVRNDCVRLYKYAPTFFGVATSEAMLLNPYPIKGDPEHNATFIVLDTPQQGDIYDTYKKHLSDLWDDSTQVPPGKWPTKARRERVTRKKNSRKK